MAGQEVAHVLDAQVSLDHRLGEVAESGGDGDHDTEHERMRDRTGIVSPRVDPTHSQHDRAGHHGQHDTADESLYGLVRTRRG